jgi:glycerol uptake facilitator-like aquaporin
VLFVTLVLFQFPYLNGYIVFMYETCVIGRVSGPTGALRVLLCLVMTGVQLLAVLCATQLIFAVQNAQDSWKALTWMVSNQKLEASDDGRNMGSEFLEEFVAVTALLVGYVHLTYLNFQYNKKDEARLFRSRTHLFSRIDEAVQALPIPIAFILQVTLLVAGLLRAFPTAHLSPHVSLYLALMGYTTWGAFGWRMFGGIVGFLVAYVMFWGVYVRRTRVHKVKLGYIQDSDYFVVEGEEEVYDKPGSGATPVQRSQSSRDFNTPGGPGSAAATANSVRTRGQPTMGGTGNAISFNNAYRHVYHAI